MPEYRVAELARESGTTVRNIRAYQDRGLLPPPRRHGRVALYGDAHLLRLRLIAGLLDRGYTLTSVGELLSAWERGRDLSDVLGLEAAIGGPFSDEVPGYATADELAKLFEGLVITGEQVREALQLGYVEFDGTGYRIRSWRIVHGAAEMVAAGVSFDEVLAHARALREDADRIARRFVDLFADLVFARYGNELPPTEDLPELAELVRRLRPIAVSTLHAELALAIEDHAGRAFGDTLARAIKGPRGKAVPT